MPPPEPYSSTPNEPPYQTFEFDEILECVMATVESTRENPPPDDSRPFSLRVTSTSENVTQLPSTLTAGPFTAPVTEDIPLLKTDPKKVSGQHYDIVVNGVDMITWNDDGQIVDFKVMLRPLKAVNLIHQKMAAMLQANQ